MFIKQKCKRCKKSLKNEIGSAIEMRNHFVHGLGDSKVAIPGEEIGGEKG